MLRDDEPAPVLLVDDRPENLLALEAILDSPDYRITTAASGPEALDKVVRDDFAVILLDVAMPGMTGFDVADRLGQNERTRHIPILIVTAVATDAQSLDRGYDAGAVDYLVKPLHVRAVRSKVRVFADLWRQRRETERRERWLRQAEARDRAVRLESLRAVSAARYRKLVEGIERAFGWTAHGEGMRLTFVSRRAHELLGYPPEAFLNEGFLLECVHAADRDAVLGVFGAAVIEQREAGLDHRFVTADGRARWFHTAVSVDVDPDTQGIELHGLSTDIDELKTHEETCRRLADANRRLYEQANRSARAREEILQVVSHDLRSPLGGTRLAIDGARRALEGGPDVERAVAMLERADRAVQTMTRLVNDLVDIEALETGHLSIDKRPQEVAPLLRDAAALVEARARAKHVDIRVEAETARGVIVPCDHDRVVQIVFNLLDNAVKFSPEGRPVVVAARREQDDLRVSVTDQGPGIAPADQEHIFDRLWQAKRSTAAGLGLGLSVARSLVQAHEGHIEVASTPGHGSTFQFTLPGAEGGAAVVAGP